jgi:hypothetical protein
MELTTTPDWRTSTRSGDNGGNCVQVAVLSLTRIGGEP